jgi:hypothetical protein
MVPWSISPKRLDHAALTWYGGVHQPPMKGNVMQYFVSFSAVYDISGTVEADSEEEAIEKAKDGFMQVDDESFSYIDPHTDFFVEEDI